MVQIFNKIYFIKNNEFCFFELGKKIFYLDFGISYFFVILFYDEKVNKKKRFEIFSVC